MVKLVEKASARSLGVEHRISGKQLRSYVGGPVALLQNIQRMLRSQLAEVLPDTDCDVKFRTQYFLMRATPEHMQNVSRWRDPEPLGYCSEIPEGDDLLVISMSAIIEWQLSDNA